MEVAVDVSSPNATAAQAGADLFITNDKKLQQISIPGIRFIAGQLW
jgi:hypothetical protein